ncbi:phosphoribosylformimino-5-aminoimidazole carboxamide ribotide isomerase [Chloroherpeton thalassium ATCC 35110]|uniref:1-(5-phosphoribosyl)-5-[(5-phosphoribosylamino)methylideneamino] imidazole-4-carboxamide isomerase n=1 Tax=Chloroherpeton thalassium (strain ATCC 35110 / GB-78) TaxID=517418 RepID=HIS4_CHLT3|nr:1-(5-phosphoribosyl)-5-[(5-phosphoribosylamino)methylideneamino]imidazole-4-carboxamide isomerase [Chloroherpeton thalassium]B3QRR1.1 RecName: Full=1-(5-phosphoribosyl)-5-[(5-phosphoribosylamino)methylideneamino] imidazole-4-carboxamide isomerase; AltName: Full=Phosphoribosylformimino-5-aminoimidazole carboxamide ribotide isomerase [Chloroherpeton thalassium ATCC 35110]ACF13864.1 phosphoribosylformimino-5-aminoimidazole carboxamide ribotide isomerase [Chloroherpeton thalassium ATCC 35110]
MLIIPAIDIKGGKCVRLTRGDFEQEKIYLDEPSDMAIIWRKQNAKLIHVVDLDAALTGKPENFDKIKQIVDTLDIPIEIGGGIRTAEDAARYLDIGVYRVVIGSAAVKNPSLVSQLIEKYGPRKIVVGIDAEDGIAKISGWTESSQKKDYELALEMKDRGVERIIYTDITRDGTLEGVGYETTKAFAEKAQMRITASGGVFGKQDLSKLCKLEHLGVDSVIIGKALYEERFPCQKLWHLFEESISLDTNFSTAEQKQNSVAG